MGTNNITVPDFDFTGFYYPQLLEAAVRWLRNNVPEISSETPSDPAIQLLRAYALMGHLNNVLLDQVAHESMFPTAQLRDSLVQHLKLIGYVVNADSPAEVTCVVTLPKAYNTTTQVITSGVLFATRRTSTRDPILFEAQEDVTVNRTDQISSAMYYDASGTAFTDITTSLNSASVVQQLLPATPAVGDALYLGHDSAMTNRIKFDKIQTPMSDVYGVWEFSDNELEDALADSVTSPSPTVLKLYVNGLLDTDGSVQHTGLAVRVFYNQTGSYEDCAVQFDGATGNYVETTTLLGQTSPSLTASDYTVGTYWHVVEGLDDDTNDGNTTLEQKGNIDFMLPQSTSRDWDIHQVNGVSCYWLRFRVTHIGATPVAPVSEDTVHWSKRDTFVKSKCKQGQTRSQDPLASSDGGANQSFTIATTPVIMDSVRAFVNSVEWSQVDNFLSSTSLSNHYVVDIDSDGRATITFGDGVNGKIPPSGVNNIKAIYRTDADLDGNVGADTIVVNRSGASTVKRVTNPRPASGWTARRGATETDRTKLKVEGPASIRTLSRAVTVYDIEYLAVQFKTSDGRTPIVRAKAIESHYGPKTIGLFVVGTDGATVSIADRAELETYFNGDLATSTYGVLVANQKVTVDNYTAVPVAVTVSTVGGDKDKIETAITSLIGPTALAMDGITWTWNFGQDVPVSKIISAVLGCDVDTGGVLDVTVTAPAATVTIQDNQLPSLGAVSVTVS